MLATLRRVVADATAALDAYDHAKAMEVTESFFWTFTDDYLELVKERAYDASNPEQGSAAAALRIALTVLLRLFAPVLPFATEETWSWFADGSVHRAAWPTVDELPDAGDAGVLTTASAALIGIRRAKTDAKASQKTEVTSCVIAAPATSRAWLEAAAGDLTAVGRIHALEIAEGTEVAVTSIELAPTSD
jgi:valyl-tRNA synthetase